MDEWVEWVLAAGGMAALAFAFVLAFHPTTWIRWSVRVLTVALLAVLVAWISALGEEGWDCGSYEGCGLATSILGYVALALFVALMAVELFLLVRLVYRRVTTRRSVGTS